MDKNKKVFRINAVNPEKELITRAADLIKKGGVVVFPTKHLYGIAVDARCVQAVEKVFQIKHRARNNPLLVLVHKKEEVAALVKSTPAAALKIMEKFWPGDVTLVFEAGEHVPGILTSNTGKIGIRMPHHPVARALVNETGIPVTGTSANISGTIGASCIQDLSREIIRQADLVLDAGRLEGGIGSTVVDVTIHPVKVLRQGPVYID